MHIRRAIIFPAILALGVIGSLLTGPAMSAAAGHQASTHLPVVALHASPDTLYHS
jgi:hypothetical protein